MSSSSNKEWETHLAIVIVVAAFALAGDWIAELFIHLARLCG